MPGVSDDSLVETIRLYRETLAAIRELYTSSGSLVGDNSAAQRWSTSGARPLCAPSFAKRSIG